MRDLDNTILLAARAAGCLLSFSSVSKWQRCQLQWKFSYIDKILTPPNRAMLMGTLFDEMCETGNTDAEEIGRRLGLSAEDCAIVADRYNKYKHHINYDTDVFQMLVWAKVFPSEGFVSSEPSIYLHGYVDNMKLDLTRVDENGPKPLPIDYKFTQKPVNGKAKEHWKQQARYYIWMLQQMGYDVDRFEFHVANAVNDTIDIIKYKPTKKTVARVPTEVMAAYEGMQAQWYPPNIDRHCAWCDHEKQCDEFRTRRLEL